MITKIINISDTKHAIKFYGNFPDELFSTLLKRGYTGVIHKTSDNRCMIIHAINNPYRFEYRKKTIRGSIKTIDINNLVYNIIQGYHDTTIDSIGYYDDIISRRLYSDIWDIYVVPNNNLGKEELKSVNLDYTKVSKNGFLSKIRSIFRKDV